MSNWKHDDRAPDKHKDARHVRKRVMEQKLDCPNCGGLVCLGLSDRFIRDDLSWEQELVRLLDHGGFVLMRIEEAEHVARELGARPKDDG